MKELERAIGIGFFLIFFFAVRACASTDKIQTYVSKSGLISSPQCGYSGLLFAQQMEDSIRAKQVDSIKLKDPKMAVFYAFIPGIVVHGSGHFYARKTKTGFLLLGAEVVGVSLVGWSAFATAMGGYDPGVELLGFGGLMLFVGSWVYDVVGSPIAVVKTNKNLFQGNHSGLKLQIKDENLKLVVIWRF
jgi:hypothetical protein